MATGWTTSAPHAFAPTSAPSRASSPRSGGSERPAIRPRPTAPHRAPLGEQAGPPERCGHSGEHLADGQAGGEERSLPPTVPAQAVAGPERRRQEADGAL